MKIFVISLVRSIDRRSSIQQQMLAQELDFEFIDAVDGTLLTHQLTTDAVLPGQADERPDLRRPAVVGCALSHRAAYQRIVDENLSCALILEDDVRLSPDFGASLPTLEEALRSDEVILMYFQSNYPIHLSSNNAVYLPGGRRLLDISRFHYLGGATAYLVSQAVAAKVAQVQQPIRYVADEWPRFRDHGACVSFRLTYPYLVEHGVFASEIGYGPPWTRRVPKFLRPLLEVIRRFRLRYLIHTRQQITID